MQKLCNATGLTVLILLFSFFTPNAGELRFASENIYVALFPPDTVEVTGEYFFTASDSNGIQQRLLYPFPADSTAMEPCSISVFKSDDKENVPFNRVVNGISFPVKVPKGDTAAVTVIYRQRFSGNTGRYILTTTAQWGQPLLNSTYILKVPLTTTLSYLSYECDTVYTSGKRMIYSFFKKKFMPDRDLVFTWE